MGALSGLSGMSGMGGVMGGVDPLIALLADAVRNIDVSLAASSATLPDTVNSANNAVAGTPGTFAPSPSGRQALRFSGSYYTFPAITGNTYTIYLAMRLPRASLSVFSGVAGNYWYADDARISSVGHGAAVQRPQVFDRWVVLCWVRTSTSNRMYFNGRLCSGGTSGNSTNFSFANLGGFSASSFPIVMDMGQLAYFASAHSAAVVAETSAALLSKWGGADWGSILVCDGNSLCYGGGTDTSYPYALRSLLGDGWMVQNVGINGRDTATLLSEAVSKVDAYATFGAATKRIYVLNEVGNSLGAGASNSSIIADLKSLCQGRKTAGLQVIVQTCTKSNNVGYWGPRDTDRLLINAEILNPANLGVYWDAVVDVAADSRMSNPDNTTYFNADKTHWIAAGNTVVAGLVNAVINTL